MFFMYQNCEKWNVCAIESYDWTLKFKRNGTRQSEMTTCADASSSRINLLFFEKKFDVTEAAHLDLPPSWFIQWYLNFSGFSQLPYSLRDYYTGKSNIWELAFRWLYYGEVHALAYLIRIVVENEFLFVCANINQFETQ